MGVPYGKGFRELWHVEMERLAAGDGPTQGRILRPSDGQPALNVAFVQCAGSRDENHLPYCSAVCCMASLKQIRYLREKNPEVDPIRTHRGVGYSLKEKLK